LRAEPACVTLGCGPERKHTTSTKLGDTMTLDELLAVPILGNHNDDSALLNELSAFAMDARNQIADRAKALRQINKVMGITEPDMIDSFLVANEVRSMQKLFGEDFHFYFPHAER
jgi:hypothetical protein